MSNMQDDRIVRAEAFKGWAVLELMGHRIRAGEVSEVEIAGGKMLRIDIHCDDGVVLTEYYSTSAIYALRPCSEEIARREMRGYHDPRPVRPVEYRERERPRQIAHEDENEEDEMAF